MNEHDDEPPTCPICEFPWSGTHCRACGFVEEPAAPKTIATLDREGNVHELKDDKK